MPRKKKDNDPNKIIKSKFCEYKSSFSNTPNKFNTKILKNTAKNKERPPILTIFNWCIFLVLGLSINPNLRPILITIGVRNNAIANDINNASIDAKKMAKDIFF